MTKPQRAHTHAPARRALRSCRLNLIRFYLLYYAFITRDTIGWPMWMNSKRTFDVPFASYGYYRVVARKRQNLNVRSNGFYLHANCIYCRLYVMHSLFSAWIWPASIAARADALHPHSICVWTWLSFIGPGVPNGRARARARIKCRRKLN